MQSAAVDRPTIDRTEIPGRFDITLTFAPDGAQFGGMHLPEPAEESAAPSIFTAIREQLGLKLEPLKAPIEVIVIDNLDKPTAN